MLFASDLITQYIPWYYITSQYLHRFQVPIWVPNIYGLGYPLLAEGEIGALSPINALILLIFPFPLAINMLYLAYFLIAAGGTYFFLKLNKLSKISSLFGAFVFCLSGYMVTRYFQPSIIFTAAFIPLGFYLIQKAITNQKTALFLAPLVYLQVTAGHLQIALISTAGYLAYALLLYSKKYKWQVAFLKIVLAIILGFVLSSVQILPSLKLFQLSTRQNFDPNIRFSYSLPPSQLITYIKPYAFGISKPGDDLGFRQFGGGFWEINLTIWTIPFLLALIPAFLLLKKPKETIAKNKIIAILYILWIAFILISFGGFFKPYRIVAHIPSFPFRAPARFMIISTLAASALSAIGFEILTKKMNPPAKAAVFTLILISILIQQQKLLQEYFITKSSTTVMESLNNLTTYKMVTPLRLLPNYYGKSLYLAFQKEFQIGLILSFSAALILCLWYLREKSS